MSGQLRLTDAEIDWVENPLKGPAGLPFNSYLRLLCTQAREANRLLAGLSALKVDILARVLAEENWPPLETVKRIRELLEGGE